MKSSSVSSLGTSDKYPRRGKIYRLLFFINFFFTFNNSYDNNINNYIEVCVSNRRTNSRCLSQQGRFFGPEIDMLKDAVSGYFFRGHNNNNNDRGDKNPEVVEPVYGSVPPRNYRDHRYYHNNEDIRTHDNYDISDNCGGPRYGMHNPNVSEVVTYYKSGDPMNNSVMRHPVYYETKQVDNALIPKSSMLGYLKHFLLDQQLFASPVLNRMAPLIFLMFVYYVISALISNFRHVLALYFLARIVKLHYNNN
ncbi:hypothetical protein MKS88_002571 [Plasmodium brasilianum]|uniref:Uncharacterized protein n=2 Tax=Plasmodium (Plasmodium) TaxID=418103 RepID=A0A1A8X6F4_PLAMA|nr:hypothetical protein MKS88_002571 [Plasmodium brasilianum]SBS99338.1 Plasmodium exported protein, unknown function [Plasmodium malariae]